MRNPDKSQSASESEIIINYLRWQIKVLEASTPPSPHLPYVKVLLALEMRKLTTADFQ